jgi:nucleotide-binding universal stress UspA family protein
MKEIAVAFGSHRFSSRAVEWASQIAIRSGAHLTVLHVVAPVSADDPPELHQSVIDEEQGRLAELLRYAGHFDVAAIVQEGQPTDELLRLGARVDADLIVVGHHGSGDPGPFGPPPATELLLQSSHRPFAVVGDDAPLPEIHGRLTMVVGVDGSRANADSIEKIAVLAEAIDARTIPVLARAPGAVGHRREVDPATSAARLPGDEALETVHARAGDALLGAADRHDADLIAIGTRSRDGHDLGALGETTRNLVDRSARAVLVCPHDP